MNLQMKNAKAVAETSSQELSDYKEKAARILQVNFVFETGFGIVYY